MACSQAYVVTIRLDFESVAGRDEFLEHFADSEAAVVSEEPGVSVYRPSIDIADPTKIAIIERFQDKEAWVHHHEASAFKTLIAWFDGSGIKATRTIDRFQETSIGFWAR